MFNTEKANKLEKEINGEAVLEDYSNINLDEIVKSLPITWGIPAVDEKFGLLDFNKLVIVPWEAWSWKTTFTIQMAMENAKNWIKTAYLSLEMWAKGLVVATAKKAAWIEMQTVVGKAIPVTDRQKEIFTETVNEMTALENLDLIGYAESLTLKSFEKELERLAVVYDLIFIDNLWFVGRTDSRKESELTPLITECCMNVRKNHKVTLVALTHMTKGSEKQEWPRGRSAIRGSWKVIDDADKIVQVFREGNNTSIILQKDRDNGLNANVPLIFNAGRFSGDCFSLLD